MMKKLFGALVLFVLLAHLSSCVFTYNLHTDNPETNDKQEAKPKVCEEVLGVQYIRTDGYSEFFEYPRLISITSRAELDSYYNYFSGIYSLGERESVYSDSTIGFITACEKYDKEYFKKNDLYLLVLEEASGSVRHSVDSVDCGRVQITSHIPEVCTDDMAEWHIVLEVPKGEILLGVNASELEIHSPDSLYEKFLRSLEEIALTHLKDRYSITDAVLRFCEKTDFGSIKDTGFNNPLGYNPGYDSSPVWQMDFVDTAGESFTLFLSDSMFVFGSIGLEY